jgi:fucose 4-O-acetylase-like acetyltransferase
VKMPTVDPAPAEGKPGNRTGTTVRGTRVPGKMVTGKTVPGKPVAGRFLWMDLLRGLAIVLVVFHHTVELLIASNGDIPLARTIDNIFDPFRMVTLIFLSGMLLPRSLAKSPRVFVLGKLARIGWPYVLWSVLVLALLRFTGNTSVDARSFLEIFYAPSIYLWYLGYVLVYYLIALVVPRVVRGLLIPVSVLAAAFLGEHFELQRFLFLFAFFLLGEAAARHSELLEAALNSRLLVVFAVPLAAGTSLAAVLGYSVRYQTLWVIGAAGGVYVLVVACREVARLKPAAFVAGFGRDSLVFYVTHWAALRVSWHVLDAAGVRSTPVLFAGMFLAGFAFPLALIQLKGRLPVVDYLFQLPIPGHWTASVVPGRHSAARIDAGIPVQARRSAVPSIHEDSARGIAGWERRLPSPRTRATSSLSRHP